MNVYAHLQVAVITGHSPTEGFGAMLPDLVRMAGAHLPPTLPVEVATGVWLHHRTDEVFHAHPAFVAGSARVRSALGGLDMPRGAARAIAHVGWELLLDGVLAGVTDLSAWGAAMATAPQVAPIDPLGHWTGLVTHLSDSAWPLHYVEPAWIAQRLVHILGARPRLAFDPSLVDDVTAALAAEEHCVAETGPGVLHDVVSAVRALPAPSDPRR